MPIIYQGVSLFTEEEMQSVLQQHIKRLNKSKHFNLAKKTAAFNDIADTFSVPLNKYPSVIVNGKHYYRTELAKKITDNYLDFKQYADITNVAPGSRTPDQNIALIDIKNAINARTQEIDKYITKDYQKDPVYDQLSDAPQPSISTWSAIKHTLFPSIFGQDPNLIKASFGANNFGLSDLRAARILNSPAFKERTMRADPEFLDSNKTKSATVKHLTKNILSPLSSKDWWLHLNSGGSVTDRLFKMLSSFQRNPDAQHMASGGTVNHPGEPKGQDTIPAWLSPNEYVINSESAAANKNLLDKINQTKGPVYLAGGGGVGGMATKLFTQQFAKQNLRQRIAAGDAKAVKKLAKMEAAEQQEKIAAGINAPFEMMGGDKKFGDVLSSVGSAVSLVSGPIGMFVTGLGKSIETLRAWNDSIMKANFKFAEFSASMAQVKANQEVREIQLSAARGETRAPFAEVHAQSAFKLESKLSVLEDRFANNTTILVTAMNEVASNGVDLIRDALNLLGANLPKDIAENINQAGAKGGLLGQEIGELRGVDLGWIKGNDRGKAEEFIDLPKRFGGGR